MKIHIMAVGQKMPDWVKTAWNDYAKRLPHELNVVLHEIKPTPRNLGKPAAQMMALEAKAINSAIATISQHSNNSFIVALDEHGKDVTTKQFSQHLQQWQDLGQDVVIIIGGPDGLDQELKQQAQLKLRLSSLTMPHPMVRVLLIEQIYRAWSILTNHPYHRE